MPEGCFVILLPDDSDYKVLGYHFSSGKSEFEITSNIFLRLNLDHSKNEYNYLKLKEDSIISYLHNFKGKLARKASGMIIGIFLSETDNPDKQRTTLKNLAAVVENLDLLNLKKEEFEIKLKQYYEENLQASDDIFNPEIIKENIINRTKQMLGGNKKDRARAQELLQKLQENEHAKISILNKQAEAALKMDDFNKASKFLNNAADIADELLEKEIAKVLREKASVSGIRPKLVDVLNLKVKQAREHLKKEDFHMAYMLYKKAAEAAGKLLDKDREEEYNLKSKALQDFYQIDQKFKKKKK